VTLTAWRIYKRKHAKAAFTGHGARLYGGRWNTRGVAMIYTSGSRALASLEMLVHLETPEALKHYMICAVTFNGSLVQPLDLKLLPANWRHDPAPFKLQQLGDNWITSGKSPVLQVPSAIVPGENNYLLNPRHPDFAKLTIATPEPFNLDRRLKKLIR
jgi:RES domain-containing protein